MATEPHHHVYVDVTNAQAGRPAVILDEIDDGPLERSRALLLADDIRRAALTADELHREHGDDRDPERVEVDRVRSEHDDEPF